MKTVCIAFAQGCPRSQVGTAKLFEYFRANGWYVQNKFEKADLILVAGCGVDTCSEQGSIKAVSIAESKRNSNSQLVVLGCLASISEKLLDQKFDAIMVPPVKINELDQIINAKIKLSQFEDPNYIEPYVNKARKCFSPNGLRRKRRVLSSLTRKTLIDIGWMKGRYRNLEPLDNVFSIKVARGCLGECSYCAIRFAEGELVSKPLEKVLAEFDAGLQKGYKEFKIIAGDLGAYGQDIGTNIAELLQKMLSRKGEFRLILLDFDPQYFIRYSSELIKTLSPNSEKIGLLMVPIQSGSERILKLMRRGHTAKQARECLWVLRSISEQIPMSTHVLVGFPGETEEDFEDTIDFLKAVRFNRIDIYQYSDRPKTEASKLENKVPEDIKKMRVRRLREKFGKTSILV